MARKTIAQLEAELFEVKRQNSELNQQLGKERSERARYEKMADRVISNYGSLRDLACEMRGFIMAHHTERREEHGAEIDWFPFQERTLPTLGDIV